MNASNYKPSNAFVAAAWASLFIGAGAFMVGLWNSGMARSEKGFYFVVILYGLFAAISLQKSIRDRLEGIRVTNQYYALCWMSIIICAVLFVYGLMNADKTTLALSEKGFFAMSFVLALFGAIVVQKNTRDLAMLHNNNAE